MTTKEQLTSIMEGETMLTTEKAIEAFSFITDTLVNAIEQSAPKEGLERVKQEYATPSQLARVFGVTRGSMLRSLNRLVLEGLLKPLRLPQDGEGHPRYKIADVLALCADSAQEQN